jgi:hypothetical protein
VDTSTHHLSAFGHHVTIGTGFPIYEGGEEGLLPSVNILCFHRSTLASTIQTTFTKVSTDLIPAAPLWLHDSFDIMNTVNSSTGLTPFQLRFGKSPRILPPLPKPSTTQDTVDTTAREIVSRMSLLEMEAKDTLLKAKVSQASQVNTHRTVTFPFKVGDRVMRSTLHRRREYKSNKMHRTAKFMPHFDGPYVIITTDKAHSTVTLDLPDNPRTFPIFHTSEVRLFTENDDNLFPNRALHPPDPIVVDGQKEFFIDKIVDEHRRGRG